VPHSSGVRNWKESHLLISVGVKHDLTLTPTRLSRVSRNGFRGKFFELFSYRFTSKNN